MTVIEEIAAERKRQIEKDGWSSEHDDQHFDGSLATAAACYAAPDAVTIGRPTRVLASDARRLVWPWDFKWWKPRADQRRNLIKAGALIVAEIERLDRAEQNPIEEPKP